LSHGRAADILNGHELYHVNPTVVAAASRYEIAKAGGEILAHAAHHAPSILSARR
jgi:hypothetical protein